jgi:hypothetical protein
MINLSIYIHDFKYAPVRYGLAHKQFNKAEERAKLEQEARKKRWYVVIRSAKIIVAFVIIKY